MINCETKGCGKKTNNRSGYCSECRQTVCWHCDEIFLPIEKDPLVHLCWGCKARTRVLEFYRKYKNKNGKYMESTIVTKTVRRKTRPFHMNKVPQEKSS